MPHGHIPLHAWDTAEAALTLTHVVPSVYAPYIALTASHHSREDESRGGAPRQEHACCVEPQLGQVFESEEKPPGFALYASAPVAHPLRFPPHAGPKSLQHEQGSPKLKCPPTDSKEEGAAERKAPLRFARQFEASSSHEAAPGEHLLPRPAEVPRCAG